MQVSKIPVRVTRILSFFLVCFAMIAFRIWYLSVVAHDHYEEESLKPMTRTVIETPERGTICDRFGVPLALNAPKYNVAIQYSDIRQIPRTRFVRNEKGKKVRLFARRTYIEDFTKFLAEILEMDAKDIEDLVHGKACLFPHTPFVLKEDISEKLYYKLLGQEKNWPGLSMQQKSRRVYPHGKLACDLVGYIGAISPGEYLRISEEITGLRTYLLEREAGQAVFLPKGFSSPEEVQNRLLELEETAYTINDYLGKSGVEAAFDAELRGSIGKSFYRVDTQGNIQSPLPGGYSSKPGQRINVSISSKLQAEAEKLLSEYEHLQDLRDRAGAKKRTTPWQRGGAIVAMDPKTGEVLALASYPRFDANDLVPMRTAEMRKEKQSSILKWLESPNFIGEIWDGKRPMEREVFVNGSYETKTFDLTWDSYIDLILDSKSAVRKALDKVQFLRDAIYFDDALLDEIPFEKDKNLLIDLISLIAPKGSFSAPLLAHVGDQTLPEFHYFRQMVASHLAPLKETAKSAFHKTNFRTWREENFQAFLKAKRKEEKNSRRYAKPYIEYLEKEEQMQFAKFWENHKLELLHKEIFSNPELEELKELLVPLTRKDQLTYLRSLRTFEDLNEPLVGKYRMLRSENGVQKQKHLASAFYPYSGFGFGRSQAFRQATPMGSIFKVIPAYAGIKQNYDVGAHDLNPLTLVDDMQWTNREGSNAQVLGRFLDGTVIKRLYKGGRLPRAYPKIGTIDVTEALERTSNIYFSILAGDILAGPSTLLKTAMKFGLGSKTGVDLPGEYKGNLPDDIHHNKTGLYSFAIGQHSLVATPLQAAVAFSSLVNGGKILKPQILKTDKPEINDLISMPEPIRDLILEGMRKVTNGEKGSARESLLRASFHDKDAFSSFKKLKSQLVGKTGTAEIFYKQTIDAESSAALEKHIWFAGIGFEDELLQTPELVIIVYSRFGSAGKQGAPIAAQMLNKWREIKESQ